MYYGFSFVLVKHSVRHEPIFVSFNVFVILFERSFSIKLFLTLAMPEICHWPSINGIAALECLQEFTISVLRS